MYKRWGNTHMLFSMHLLPSSNSYPHMSTSVFFSLFFLVKVLSTKVSFKYNFLDTTKCISIRTFVICISTCSVWLCLIVLSRQYIVKFWNKECHATAEDTRFIQKNFLRNKLPNLIKERKKTEVTYYGIHWKIS